MMNQEQEKKYKPISEFTLTYKDTNKTVPLQELLDRHKEWVQGLTPRMWNLINSNSIFVKTQGFSLLNKSNQKKLNINDFEKIDLSEIILPTITQEDSLDVTAYPLTGAFLEHMSFRNASLCLANFNGAVLIGADFSSAVLSDSNFTGACLGGAIFENTELKRVKFNEIEFSDKSDFRNAKLQGASFIKAILRSADFTNAELSEIESRYDENIFIQTNFESANLSKAVFVGADLTDAILKNADLTGANLSQAILERADLSGADLTDANLSGTNLKNAILTGAIINQKTLDLSKNIIKEGGGTAINGLFARNEEEGYESAALLPLNPKADSKLGRSADVVVENLKHAQHLTGVYWLMSATILVNFLCYFFEGLKNPLDKVPILNALVDIPEGLLFGLSLVFVPIILFMIRQGLEKAYEGSKYLQTRDEIYKVGAFAWTLTQYVDPKDKKLPTILIVNLYRILRFLMVFCAPISLTLILFKPLFSFWFVILFILSFILLVLSVFIFITSILGLTLTMVIFIFIKFITLFLLTEIFDQISNISMFHLFINCFIYGVAIWVFHIVEQFQKPLVFDAYKDSPKYIEDKEKEDLKKEVEREIEKENLRKSIESGRE